MSPTTSLFPSFPGAMLDSGQQPRPPPRSRRRAPSDTLTTSTTSTNRHNSSTMTTTTTLLAMCVFTAATLATVADAGESRERPRACNWAWAQGASVIAPWITALTAAMTSKLGVTPQLLLSTLVSLVPCSFDKDDFCVIYCNQCDSWQSVCLSNVMNRARTISTARIILQLQVRVTPRQSTPPNTAHRSAELLLSDERWN